MARLRYAALLVFFLHDIQMPSVPAPRVIRNGRTRWLGDFYGMRETTPDFASSIETPVCSSVTPVA